MTPLISAAINGHVKVVELLLDKGADVNKTDKDGNTALKLATQYGHSETVTLLDLWY